MSLHQIPNIYIKVIRPFCKLICIARISQISIILSCIFPSAYATHIVGGDITYRCLGNQQYEITLTLRRDCLNGNPGAQFDNPAAMGIFDRQGRLQSQLGNVGRLLMEFRQDDTLNEVLSKTCGIVGGDVCVHTTTYIDTVELPYLAGGYILAYQRCCRNYTIRNIVDPLESGATYTLEISEEALRQCNSSPLLGAYPPIYICGGLPIAFDLKAKDADGDSLVYKMCTPYLGADQLNPRPATPSNPPYDLVIFSGAYSLADMIGGSPPLHIGQSNGFMAGFAEPVIAQYLIAYCVEEYRNEKLLSVLRRDFQINVRICNSTPIAEFDLSYLECRKPFELQLQNQSTDPFSTLEKYYWEFKINGKTQTSDLQHPLFVTNDTGLLEIKLIVESAEPCSDTIIRQFTLNEPGLEFNFRMDTICQRDSVELVKIFDPDYQYEWTPKEGLSCSTCPNPKASPIKNTRYLLKSYNNQCVVWDTFDIYVKPCIIDPCFVQLSTVCLPNGMVQVTAIDGNSNPVQTKIRERELFWNISKHANHPEYTLQNQNPILLFKDDIFSVTYKYYTWPAGRPKSVEYADICQQKIKDTVSLTCSGPCADLKFLLSSCEDDYHEPNQLNYPASICKTICGGACQFIIGLFETNGNLVDPSDYEIRWSNGATGSYVELMAPYHNNLSVTVRKGDCIWSGKYIKSCSLFKSVLPTTTQLNAIHFRKGTGNQFQTNSCVHGQLNYLITTLDGKLVCTELKEIELIPSGVYLLTEGNSVESKSYLLFVE